MGLLSLSIWIPIFFGILIIAIGRDSQAEIVRWIALIGALFGLAVTIPLVSGFTNDTAAMQFVEKFLWIEKFNIHYHLGIDGISLWLIPLTAFITVIVVISAWDVINTWVHFLYYLD